MSTDPQLIVNVEVVVPHIVLPTWPARFAPEALTEERAQIQPEQLLSPDARVTEDVLLSPHGVPNAHDLNQGHTQRSTPALMQRNKLFRLFPIKASPLQAQPQIVQVIRRWSRLRGKHEDRESPRITDEMVFTLEARPLRNEESFNTELIPGLRRVSILLDEEDRPVSYRSDGAEN